MNNSGKSQASLHRQSTIMAGILSFALLMPTCAISTETEITAADKPQPITNELTKALALTPDIANGKKIYPLCGSCHMKTGWGKKDGSFPDIAGQHRNVLIKQMEDIRNKHRDNPTMYPFSDPAEIGGLQGVSDVTAYIEQLPPTPDPGVGKGDNLANGKKAYHEHCAQCHGDKGQGNNNAFFPKLKGQHHAYLLRQLRWIREGYRKNSNEAMLIQLKTLSDAELDAVADYLSRL